MWSGSSIELSVDNSSIVTRNFSAIEASESPGRITYSPRVVVVAS